MTKIKKDKGEKRKMSKFVRIQSTRPITVTGGLQAIDMTDPKSTNADKLNVKPSWTAFRVFLKQGTGYYPARIKNWNSVKLLSAKEVLTVGEVVDELPKDYKDKENAEKVYKELEYEYSRYEKQSQTLEKANKAKKETGKKNQSNLIDMTEED